MSLPKHDPSLAAFIKNLDPSLYTISGGDSTSSQTSNEVKNLREQTEYQWYQDEMRNGTLPSTSSKELYRDGGIPLNYETRKMVPYANQVFRNLDRYNEQMSKSDRTGRFLFGALVGGIIVLVVLKCL